ncbi:MAG: hypothetical protein ACKV2T_39925 [Kofleriaceae bacterium]
MSIHHGIVSTLLVALAMTRAAHANTNCTAFRKEQRIEAKKDGEWMKSTVVRCDPRKGFLIHFDGFSSANDAWLFEGDLRAPAAATTPTPVPSAYRSNDYVHIQRKTDAQPFVAKLWNAGPTSWSYMSGGVEHRIDASDIKGKWDPSTMKYKVGQKVRYVAGGFYPATIKAIEAGGYRADITGGVTNTNVLFERDFTDDWRYEEFEQAIAPVRQLKDGKLEWLVALDAGTQSSLQPPHEPKGDGVPEFEKVIAAYETVDRIVQEKFKDLPPLLRATCTFCPRYLADVITRHKKLFERTVPLDPSSAVKEFLRNMEPSEDYYLNDYRPCPECDVLSAKDPKPKAQQLLAKRIGRQIAYAKALGIPPQADIPALEASITGFIKKWDAMVRKKAPLLDSFAKEKTSLAGRDAKLVGPAKSYLSHYPTSTCKLIGSEKHDWRADGTGDDHVGRFKYVVFDCTDPAYRYPFVIAVAVKQGYLGFGKYDSVANGAWDLQSYYRR